MDSGEKQAILETEYGIPMTKELQEEVLAVCKLSEGVFQRGIEQGLEQGIEQGAI